MDTVCSTSQGTRPSLFCGLQRHDHDARFRPYFQDAKLLSYGGHCSLFLVQKYDGASAFLFEARCPTGGALVARLAALGERIGNPALVAWRGYQGWVIADRVEEPLLSSYLEGDLAEGARAVLARNFVDLTCTMVDRGLLPLDWGKLVLQVTATAICASLKWLSASTARVHRTRSRSWPLCGRIKPFFGALRRIGTRCLTFATLFEPAGSSGAQIFRQLAALSLQLGFGFLGCCSTLRIISCNLVRNERC